jgi:predicted regulator of Ras-like GTPase activity (Roadblock/LC7/MglB family)
MSDDNEPRRLVFFKEDIEAIANILNTFLRNAKANGVLLVDKQGHFITREGASPDHDMDTISALVAASFPAAKQMAQLLGEKDFAVMFQSEKKDYIQLSLVGDRTVLAVLFQDLTSLGIVRLHASQVAVKLTELFRKIADRGPRGPDSFGTLGPAPAPA